MPPSRPRKRRRTIWPCWKIGSRSAKGRRQVYGSQIGINGLTGKHYVSPLDDPDHVDQRRASVGLPPMADYVKHWDIVWDVEAYKKLLPELEKPRQ